MVLENPQELSRIGIFIILWVPLLSEHSQPQFVISSRRPEIAATLSGIEMQKLSALYEYV